MNPIERFWQGDTLNRVELDGEVVTTGKLFVPLYVQLMLRNLMGTITTIIIGHHSQHAVAAVGTAVNVIALVLAVYTLLDIGSCIVISQHLGAERRAKAHSATWACLLLCLLIGTVCTLVLTAFARPVMHAMQVKGVILEDAIVYMKIVMSFSIVQALNVGLSAVVRSHGQPRFTTYASLLTGAVNVALCAIVVFRPFETPLHGISGIAIAAVISEAIGLVVLAWFTIHNMPQLGVVKDVSLKELRGAIGHILRVGIPGGIASISYSLSQSVSTSIIASLGEAPLTAKIYVSSVITYVCSISAALGQGTSLMVGRLVGARRYDQAIALNRQNVRISLLTNFLLATCLFVSADYVMRIFTNDPQIIALARMVCLVDIFVEIGRAINHIQTNTLYGAGDSMYHMVFSIISCWVIAVGFSYLLGVQLGWGLVGCWIAFALDEVLRGVIFLRRWNSRKWIVNP